MFSFPFYRACGGSPMQFSILILIYYQIAPKSFKINVPQFKITMESFHKKNNTEIVNVVFFKIKLLFSFFRRFRMCSLLRVMIL